MKSMLGELDPALIQRMDDWGSLLDCAGLKSPSEGGTAPPELEYSAGVHSLSSQIAGVLMLGTASKRRLLALWFRQAVAGRSVVYSTTPMQVWSYSLHDSDLIKALFELATLSLMALPAFYVPYCSVRTDESLSNHPPEVWRMDLLNDEALTALLLLGLTLQFLEIYLQWHSSPTSADTNRMLFDKSRFWKRANLLVCIAVTIDAISFYISPKNPLVLRALLPVIFIARRDNLQHLFEGTFVAMRKSLRIYRIVVLAIILWAFAGYCLFNRLEAPAGTDNTGKDLHFGTYWSSLYTCFKCYLSRPSVLWTLQGFYNENQATALFFVSLTLVADIFGSSLIIATGARHFRDFASQCFRFKLKNRREALLAVFAVLRDLDSKGILEAERIVSCGDDGDRGPLPSTSSSGVEPPLLGSTFGAGTEITADTWIVFCAALLGDYSIAPPNALQIFALESPTFTPVSQLQFFRLCGALASKPRFSKFQSSLLDLSIIPGAGAGSSSVLPPWTRDNNSNSMLHTVRVSGREKQAQSHSQERETKRVQEYCDGIKDHDCFPGHNNSNSIGTAPGSSPLFFSTERNQQQQQEIQMHAALDITRKLHSLWHYFKGTIKRTVKTQTTKRQRQMLHLCADRLAHFGWKAELKHSWLGKPLVLAGFKTRLKFKPFALFGLLAHGLLIYQLTEISSRCPTSQSIALSWALLAFFSFENLVHFLAHSEDRATTVRDSFINFLVLLTMIALGTDPAKIKSQTLTILIVFQSLRSWKLFSLLRGAQALYSISSIVARALLLIAFFVYFFGLFGHVFFCGTFNETKASAADDDAQAWLRYSDVLNFNSFLASCYTMSQIIVISNWAMVMDAAIEVLPYRGFAFFYSFKALMNLAVMPLMISLVINAFIAQLNRINSPPDGPSKAGSGSNSESNADGTLRNKMKAYLISSEVQFSSAMVAMWSPTGRETLPAFVGAVAQPFLVAAGVGAASSDTLKGQEKDEQETADTMRADIARLHLAIAEVELKYFGGGTMPRGQGQCLGLTDVSDFIPPSPTTAEAPVSFAHRAGSIPFFASALTPALRAAAHTSINIRDPRILEEMAEWYALDDDMALGLRPVGAYERAVYAIIANDLRQTLPSACFARLAYLWFHDSIHARHIALPTSPVALYLYKAHRSKWFLNLCNLLVVLQLAATAVVSSPCSRGGLVYPMSIIDTRTSLAVVNLFLAVLYGSETAVNLYLGGQGGNWTRARLACCFFVTVDSFLFLANPAARPMPSVAIIPMFWITRSNTFREVVMGLYSSLRRSGLVYNLLFAFLVGWSLLGFYFFNRFDTPLGHFHTFPSTVFTVLHCFTAAPYALDALQPLFQHSKSATMYFLVITLTMEILTLSLIVATSDMQFRAFAASNLRRRLSLRRDAIVAIWTLYATIPAPVSSTDYGQSGTDRGGSELGVGTSTAPSARLDLTAWLCLCSGLEKTNFAVDPTTAQLLFSLVTAGREGGATRGEFFKLMGLIHSRARAVMVSGACAGAGAGVGSLRPSEVELTSVIPHLTVPLPATSAAAVLSRGKHNQSSGPVPVSASLPLPPPVGAYNITIHPKKRSWLSDVYWVPGSFLGRARSLCLYLVYHQVNIYIPNCCWSTSESWGLRSLRYQWRRWWRLRILDSISFSLHILLIPQLIAIATRHIITVAQGLRESDTATPQSAERTIVRRWFALGWGLELGFWLDMLVRMVALGELAYLRRESLLARAIINILSLVAILAVEHLGAGWQGGNSPHDLVPLRKSVEVLLVVQCSRLFLVFWVDQGSSDVTKILKVSARCLFLLFSVIYFFSIYAQSSFCQFIEPKLVEDQRYVMTSYAGLQRANDDSDAWMPFRDLLNFETYLQSMFTLFEIAVLGSWSMVMDAAAKTDATKAYGFFYPFRLLIILAVLPLLNGLVIRSYVLIMDQQAGSGAGTNADSGPTGASSVSNNVESDFHNGSTNDLDYRGHDFNLEDSTEESDLRTDDLDEEEDLAVAHADQGILALTATEASLTARRESAAAALRARTAMRKSLSLERSYLNGIGPRPSLAGMSCSPDAARLTLSKSQGVVRNGWAADVGAPSTDHLLQPDSIQFSSSLSRPIAPVIDRSKGSNTSERLWKGFSMSSSSLFSWSSPNSADIAAVKVVQSSPLDMSSRGQGARQDTTINNLRERESSVRIERNSFLSFWATGSGGTAPGGQSAVLSLSLDSSVLDHRLQHENLATERERLREVCRRVGLSES